LKLIHLELEISQSTWKSIFIYTKTTYLIISRDKILSFFFKIPTFIYQNLEFGGLQIFQILKALCGGSCCTSMGAAPLDVRGVGGHDLLGIMRLSCTMDPANWDIFNLNKFVPPTYVAVMAEPFDLGQAIKWIL
jgi:hypothetical protein